MDHGHEMDEPRPIPWGFTITVLVGLAIVAFMVWVGLHFLLNGPQTPLRA